MIAVLAYVALVVTVTGLPLATWANLPLLHRKHAMPRLTRALCTAYALTAAALISGATLAHLHHTDTTARICALAAALLIVAIIREDLHTDHHPRPRVQRPEPEPRLDPATDEATRGWTALHSACCLTSWESRGRHHDPITCTRKA